MAYDLIPWPLLLPEDHGLASSRFFEGWHGCLARTGHGPRLPALFTTYNFTTYNAGTMSSPKPPPPHPAPGNAPNPGLAPHVRRAVAAVQAKPAQALQSRNPAPHVQRAVATVQAKAQPAPAARTLAPHVQAAIQKGAPAAVQRATPPGTGVRQPAPHVQAALNRGVQAKPQSPGPRPAASHVQAAVQRVHRPGPQVVAVPAHRPTAVQRMEVKKSSSLDYKQIVSKVDSDLLKDGPGNLSTSSKEAKKWFNLADALLDKLQIGRAHV